MKKIYTIIKIGYTAGIYGCSNEYFTLIYTDKKDGFKSVSFYGMYGAEERVSATLKEKGYTQHYTQSFFGKMKRNDITKNCISEHDLLKFTINLLK
jgi:hypothetical protein